MMAEPDVNVTPGINTVNDSWDGGNTFWFQHLASKGYIVVSVDNRGTGSRGEVFKKITYKQLGKYETEDQIASYSYSDFGPRS